MAYILTSAVLVPTGESCVLAAIGEPVTFNPQTLVPDEGVVRAKTLWPFGRIVATDVPGGKVVMLIGRSTAQATAGITLSVNGSSIGVTATEYDATSTFTDVSHLVAAAVSGFVIARTAR